MQLGGEKPIGSITFLVRIFPGEAGRFAGIVEHARTGRKERFGRLEEIGDVITALLPVEERRDEGSADRGATP